MNGKSRSPLLLMRFFDSFLQERSIKWVLALGMVILLGSSLLLVTAQWHNATPVWKYVIFLGYTVALFGAGEWTYHRLGLRRTGTVLQGLIALLVPILFLALDRVLEDQLTALNVATRLVLGAATVAFSLVAAARIFGHFLRGPQPTFLASYLILAMAGSVLPWLADGAQPAAALGLWAVFAAGTMKVNRHVFWLTEEHRQPRVFGFFPIALLGGQFLTLYFLFAAPHVGLDWLGLGAVLVAVPVLAAGDALARVFQQRTGDVVRPLPWSVLAPLGVGLVLCAAGVCLAATGLADRPRPHGHALVLAAAVAAGLMEMVARRTGKSAFVWAMLAGLTIAYQFSPSFFLDLVKALARRGAELVNEPRLPYAFYGLTYLPLLAGVMTAACLLRRRGELFARPMRHYAIAVAAVLLAVSVTHAKAALPVGLVMTLVFAVQVVLFRHRLLAAPAALAWVLSAFGLSTFLTDVLGVAVPAGFRFQSLTAAAAILLVAGWWLDPPLGRLTNREHEPDRFWAREIVRNTGLLVALGTLGASVAAMSNLTPLDVLLATTAIALAAIAEGISACRDGSELRAWFLIGLGAAGAAYLAWFDVLPLHSGVAMFATLAVAILLWIGKEIAHRAAPAAVLARPFGWTAFALPMVAVGLGAYRHVAFPAADWHGMNSLALLLAGGFYFWRGVDERRKGLILLAGLILNVALIVLWRDLTLSDPQFFMIPIGITTLALVQLFKDELPERFHDPLRYTGALVILVSPVFHIVEGSWLHLITLMLASVGVALVAIGLRVRALMYTGTAFLLADLVAMLVRGSFDSANVAWLAGLTLGTAVLALGAACERNREAIVRRMRVLAEALRQWE
jgi:hypothetical protein